MGSRILSDHGKSFLCIKSREDLAAWLGTTDRKLRYLLYRLSPDDRYTTFYIKKRNGGDRKIEAPKTYLKRIQHRINSAISEIAPPTGIAKGFVKGRSILDHARLHRGKRWVVVADLADFFPSINFGRVLGAFQSRPFQLPRDVAICLAQLCCHNGALPQGAPTSPAISNLICRSLDRKLVQLAKASRVSVSRYCDDLCFSTNERKLPSAIVSVLPSGEYVPALGLETAVRSSGFSLNLRKFKVRTSHQRQMVTGLVVNRNVAAPRFWRRQLRVMMHLYRKYGEERGLAVVSGWNAKGLRNRTVKKLENLIRGKAQYGKWLDKECRTEYLGSLHRSYPQLVKILPRLSRGIVFRIMSEGDTDLLHLRSALDVIQSHGKFQELVPRYENYSESQGDKDLWETLRRLADVNVYEYVIGIFDCDNDAFMKKLAVSPGSVIRLGARVFALFLAEPKAGAANFCIESLYDRNEATRVTMDGRRLFFGDEFDPLTGLDRDGRYQRKFPKKREVVVSGSVTRLHDGKSCLLSKMDFAKMVSVGAEPFSNMNFDGFLPTFSLIRSIFDSVGVKV
jgi:RNA-directed DNA polymerase